jgi:ferredoxin
MIERAARLRLDPIACDGVGMCLLLAPALVEPDSWGYPIAATRPLSERELKQAHRVARACPRRALRVE